MNIHPQLEIKGGITLNDVLMAYVDNNSFFVRNYFTKIKTNAFLYTIYLLLQCLISVYRLQECRIFLEKGRKKVDSLPIFRRCLFVAQQRGKLRCNLSCIDSTLDRSAVHTDANQSKMFINSPLLISRVF